MWALGLELIGRLTEDAPGFHQRLWCVRIALTKEQLPWCSGTGLTCLWGKVASLPVGVFCDGLERREWHGGGILDDLHEALGVEVEG